MLLARLVDDLAPALFEVVAAPRGLDVDVTELVVHDPDDRAEVGAGDVVLALGLDTAGVMRLLEQMGGARATALLVKPPLATDAGVVAEAGRAGVAMLGLSRSATLVQVITLLRSRLTTESFGLPGEEVAGVVAGDLFALANAIAAVVDAPVTIEDRQSRVLAYSGRQDEADSARTETILGRQVPERYLKSLRDQGVFRRLLEETQPIYVETTDTQPRVAVAVRAGDEVLGSIWAAVTGPLSADRQSALADSAKLVALHLLRHRAGADVERRLRADLLATVLEGRAGVAEAATRLSLEGEAFRVLAMGVVDVPEAEQEQWHGRLWDALALHLSAVHGKSATALLGGVVYAVLPTVADEDKARARAFEVANDFVARSGLRATVLVGIGGPARKLADLGRSRIEADQVVRVLRLSGTRSNRRVADIEDVEMPALLLRLADLVEREESLHRGRLGALLRHDARHHSDYVETLSAYLDYFGDVAAAAADLHVHPNTFRYRVRKLQQIAGLDLNDPDERLGVMVQLRLIRAIGT